MSQHQTSGSITLDLDAISTAVAAALEPRLRRIETALAGTTLDDRAAVEVVTHHLPTGWELMEAERVATHLIQALARTGYRLTAVDGAALIHEAGQTTREDRWFEPGREV